MPLTSSIPSSTHAYPPSLSPHTQAGDGKGGGGGGKGGGVGSGKDGTTLDVLLMENCFYDRRITRIYDLKGSERNRFNEEAAANPHVSVEVWKCGN